MSVYVRTVMKVELMNFKVLVMTVICLKLHFKACYTKGILKMLFRHRHKMLAKRSRLKTATNIHSVAQKLHPSFVYKRHIDIDYGRAYILFVYAYLTDPCLIYVNLSMTKVH